MLTWLLIPVVVALGAAIWGSWVSKSRIVGDMAELHGYARFRDAMEMERDRAG
ncbi:hypothetical protein [Streptomyces tremellae]|uniref:hypothetical protein n=1 Tax=Streptomyces tremellae TaxID=1124239 RepID=UPI0031EAEF54